MFLPHNRSVQDRLRPRDEAPRVTSKSLFEIVRLSHAYSSPDGPVPVFTDVTLALDQGITGIVGPSGEGKSTFLNILGGLMAPVAGEVRYRGWRVPFEDEVALRYYRGRHVAVIFQELNLISHLTALDNAALPLLCQGVSRREARASAGENLCRLGLANLLGRYPHEMSRGQKQRVAIGRACTSWAEVIAGDEFTASLDPASTYAVMDDFRGRVRELGRSVILVTHDRELAQQYCDRILECREGQLRELLPCNPTRAQS